MKKLNANRKTNKQLELNDEGFTAIEAIISVIIISITVVVVMNFKSGILKNELFVNKYVTIQTEIDNNLAEIQNEWRTDSYEVDTRAGKMEVTINELGLNEYGNQTLEVNFKVEELVKDYDVDKKYEVERSAYYDE